MRLKVEFTQTRTDDIIARIINKRIVAKIRRYLEYSLPMGIAPTPSDGLTWPFDGTIYMQASMDTTVFLINHYGLSGEDMLDLHAGWPITKLVDSWAILNTVGYSACDYLKL